MGLTTEQRQQARYFVGTEVEHAPTLNKLTLFVVGVQPVEEILRRARLNDVEQIYFGTSQSFTSEHANEWQAMILGCLQEDYWVTLDFDCEYAATVLELGFDKFEKFTAMISVKLPYIDRFNSNATVKIDDVTWGATNSGVWCWDLQSLMNPRVYTPWEEYTIDKEID